MALNKEKKAEVVSEVTELLSGSKMTVFAKYPGTTVKSMQRLRSDARSNGTTIKVVKNRLFKQALKDSGKFEGVDLGTFSGQLLYAFNSEDEVAPAQSLATFAKQEPQIEFVGGLNAEGLLLSAEDIKALASLPSKDQLRAQLVGTIGAPISGFVNVLAGNVRGVLNVLNARADQIG